jgi:hypothetical protein
MTEPTPVADDAQATVPQLLDRAAQDYAHTNAVAQAHEAQGGTGQREGVLPGGTR